MGKKFDCVILCMGDAEDAYVAPLVFTTDLGSGTMMSKRDAMVALAEDLFARFKSIYSKTPDMSKCCKDDDKEFEYCPKCGEKLHPKGRFDAEEFVLNIRSILWSTNDSYGYEGEMVDGAWHEYRFMPTCAFESCIKRDSYLTIESNGARVITVIIEMLNPGTFDGIEDVECYLYPDPNEFNSYAEWFDDYLNRLFK